MLRIIREMKPFILIVLIIIGLLFFQARTDLALPEYMSNIVNVGIQQGGIENSVPEVIRSSELEKIKIFLNENEINLLNNNYNLIMKDNLSIDELNDYLKKYPALDNEDLYILNTDSKDEIDMMNSFLAKPMLIMSTIEMGVPEGKSLGENPFDSFPQGADPFEVLEGLPKEQFDELMIKIDEQLIILPDSMITQAATVYIKGEYEAIGINTENVQSNYILYIGRIMLLIALLGMTASIIVGFLSSRVAASLGRNLREKVFKKVASFSNAEFAEFSTASLITRSTNDIQQIQQFTVLLLRMVFYAPILGFGGVLKALETNTSMAWVVGVGVVGILLLVIVLFTAAMPKFKKLQKLVDKVNLVMRESLTGILVIRAFNTERFEEEKFDIANKELTGTNLFVNRLMVTMMPSMMLIMNGIMLLIVWVGAQQIDAGTMQVGDMMAFIQYAMQIIMSFLMLSMVSIILPRASVSAQRIAEVLDKEVSIKDPTNPMELKDKIEGRIEFKNVSFKYPGAEKCVLENINFTANPGETTAFIGSTGSGKSTLINLIPRFYDSTEGEVLLDNINIKDLRLHDLRENIGYVPQNSVLFSGTIGSNLKYGKNYNVNDDNVMKAIDIAQASDFVNDKEEGIDSEISQGGSNVSGGQKQRLSIARALAKKPPVFIFDDSFSALDFKTDKTLREAMNKELKGSTILIVAQRINTIMDAEKIVVLDEGKIVGIGTHKELLKTSKVYKQIALSQLSEEELAI